jgi:ribulose kinase
VAAAGRGAGRGDRHADRAAAEELGLPRSVKVVQGGADALIGMIGLGVAKPGQLALITGSSHLQFGVTEAPLNAPGVWGAYADIVYPGRYIVEGGQTSTGSIINWLGRLTGGLDFAELNAKAARSSPAATGSSCRTISRATARPIPTRCRAAPSSA